MDIKTKGFTMPNGDTHIFIPPSPTESERGGIKAKAKTTENVEVVVGDDDKLYVPSYPTSLPASDVSDWAKANTKPSYTAEEVGALPNTTNLLQLDDTLTDENKAANAKVTGDKFITIDKDLSSIHVKDREQDYRLDLLKKDILTDSYEELGDMIANGISGDYISPGDELIVNKVSSLSIVSTNNALIFSVIDEQVFTELVGECENADYLLFYNGNSWTYNGAEVTSSDLGFTISGTPIENDVITVTMTVEEVSHTFVAYTTTGTNATAPVDNNVEKYWVIEQTYIPASQTFDDPESAICVTVGHTLSAGKYYVYNNANATSDYWCNYKRLYYLFEIPNDIVATEDTGDVQIRFSSRGGRETDGDARGVYQLTCMPYRCSDDTKYNSDTIVFTGQIAEPSSEYTDIRTIDGFTTNQAMDSEGIIYNNLGHVCYGNNEWNVSNIKQRMNSDAKSMTPVRLHKNDIVTSLKGVKGFMWGFDPRFKKLINKVTTYQEHGMNDEYTRYELYSDVSEMAFLLSMKEMSFNIQTDEGVVLDLYNTYTGGSLINDAIASRGKANKSGESPSTYRWSRSANAGNSSNARLVVATGSLDSNVAYVGYRFAPAYIIGRAKQS